MSVLDELNLGDDERHDETDEPETPNLVLSAVWRSSTLGFAFLEGTTLRFSQVADCDFSMLQALKYQLRPSMIVAPSSSDPAWFAALSASSLLAPGASAEEEEEAGATEREAMADGGDEHEGEEGGTDGGGPRVLALRNRDFSPDTAATRLSLLRTLEDLPDCEMTEREVLIYLEHMVPRDQEHARRAIAGLLTFLQRSGEETGQRLAVTSLRRFPLESQLFMSPECFLSLGIFSDDHHPSAHGGRAKDGFSLWSLMNRTKSKPGERLLKQWFARPTQDLSTLRERHAFIDFLAGTRFRYKWKRRD